MMSVHKQPRMRETPFEPAAREDASGGVNE